jgi:DNA-binding winged helix-turn-helix (wHTH) protein/tetratricopeptide (TPR) repeat protein
LTEPKGFVYCEDMTGAPSNVTRYRFGPYELDPEEGILARNGIRVKLQDLPCRLLLMLVERPGEIITREEVRQRLWPENTFVEFDNSLGVAIRKVRESLNDNAEAPHYVATLPRRGYRFVAPVTVEGPRAEPGPPLEKPGFAAEAATSVPAKPQSPTFPPHWGYWAGAGLVVVLGVAAVSFRFHSKPPYVSPNAESSVAAEVRLRRSVAVLGFRNLPGRQEDDWLSPVLSEMLDTELGTRGDLRMVSGEDIARVRQALPLSEGDRLSKQTLDSLRSNPGADVVVLGSYTPLPGDTNKRIRLDLRVQDTGNGETIAEEAITGNQNDLFDLAAQAGSRLRQRLGLTANSSGDASAARLALPADQRSARLYVDGRDKLWAFDFLSARDLLLQAVAADPQFPLAHSALSEAWWHLGYVNKARAEAQRAQELARDHLAREDRLLIEGQYWRTMNDPTKAAQTYQQLFHMFPDSLDYGLLLANAQINVQPSAALQTIATLRRLPPPVGEDARIDMTEASAWIGRDLVKARTAAESAIEKGLAQGRPVLVARTYGFLCQEGVGLGASTQQVFSDCESARQSAIATGDRNGEATMITDLAGMHYEQGDMVRAEQMFLMAIQQFREVGNPEGIAVAMGNLAALRLGQGKLGEAEKMLEASVPDYQAVEDKEGVALTFDNLGDLSRQSGKLDAAEDDYRRAKATAEEIESKSAVAYVLSGLGDVYKDRGDLARSRESYEGALRLRKQIGERQTSGESQVQLARLSVEEGQAAAGENILRQWKEQFHLEQQADDELLSSIGLSEALLAQGKKVEAQREVEGSRDLAAKSQNLFDRLQYEVASARVLLSSDHPENAKGLLERALRDARAHGFVGIEFETMLAMADLEKRSGHAAVAREQLALLERAARDKGFMLVARKATAARG